MKLVCLVCFGGIFPLSYPEVSIETLGVVMGKTPPKHTKHTNGRLQGRLGHWAGGISVNPDAVRRMR